ncbi:hypothetical protein GTU79_21860 [Sodalis ligni]|jgi:hypothetical protein|uniref:Uncharacterized protein n=1 Tax=Sodalis ligni TaxID=2697027 RepID=A0A4R1NPP8_9GAMM|nr:hypothetical protein [Sodalis ligni]QWA09919.1 hypothetical protein GTU79_21860 [Sodalis ligni]TCL06706.1 hypothetical protein EZJ58_4994 [Sodalis ligni]
MPILDVFNSTGDGQPSLSKWMKGLGFIAVTAVLGWEAYRGTLTDTMLIAYFAAVIADDQIGKRQNIHHDLEKKRINTVGDAITPPDGPRDGDISRQ